MNENYTLIYFKKGSITTKKSEYTVNDPVGIHTRPADLLAKEAKALSRVIRYPSSLREGTKRLTQLP